MQVILLQDIKGLGKKGDVKNVADGYVLNFLLPKKLVTKASDRKLESFKKQLQKKENKIIKSVEEYKKMINKLSGINLIIKAKVSDSGKLFAAVNKKNIIEKIKQEKKIDINENNIKLDKHLKTVGKHDVLVDFGNNLMTKIIIKIIKDK